MSEQIKFQWQLNGKIIWFVAIFLPLTIWLGFWQLDRAEQKREILADQAERIQMASVQHIDLDSTEDLHLRRFAQQVVFDPQRWFLLENRVRNGRTGYEVLNLAQPVDQDIWLVINRGWVPASLNRDELPTVQIPDEPVLIRGYFYQPDDDFYRLGGGPTWSGKWPERLQHADLEEIESRLSEDAPLLPFRLRLSTDDSLAYEAQWEIVNQMPAKHTGYAVQWFAMAFALVVLALFANSNLGQLVKFNKG